jgi:rsbT co-antagonist protein RsbR
MKQENTALDELLTSQGPQIQKDWLAEVLATTTAVSTTTAADAKALFEALHQGIRKDGDSANLDDPAWDGLRSALVKLSSSRAAQGSSAAETSHFVLSIKRPIFAAVQTRFAADSQRLMSVVWAISTLVDKAAQLTMFTFQKTREEVIKRQQDELLELSTPVVKLWEGVLAVPMIGTLDSSRTQLVMESLLQRIVDTGSELAIIDITGVPTVDTLVAQHLLKTVTAIRLMGADCIISGVRPQIAQTIVHLGIDLQGIITKASLADALQVAMKAVGYTVSRVAKA